jgi:hypothetical protein
MRVLRDQRWWSITGASVALLGNVLVAVLWCWAVFATPAGAHARYIIEAGFSFAIATGTLVLALSFIVAGTSRHARRSARDVHPCSRSITVGRCAHADSRHAPSDYPVAVMKPNQAMQRTASKAATNLLRVCYPRFGCVARCTGLAVADLVSR